MKVYKVIVLFRFAQFTNITFRIGDDHISERIFLSYVFQRWQNRYDICWPEAEGKHDLFVRTKLQVLSRFLLITWLEWMVGVGNHVNLFSRERFDQIVFVSLIKTDNSIPVKLVIERVFWSFALVDNLNGDGPLLDFGKYLK